MKTMKRVLSFVLCLMLGVVPFVTSVAGCGKPTQYTISFYQDSAAETPFKTMKAAKDSVPDLSGVTPPDKAGDTFVGWTDARNSSTPYDTAKAIEADLDLFGMWQSSVGKKVRVTFDLNYDGSKSVVREGGAGAPLEFPLAERDYYVFKGWYRDRAGETAYESLNYPDAALTLYAKWELADGAVLVTFMLGEEKFTDAATSTGGKVAEPVCDPFEYVFLGWLDENGEPFDFKNTVINESTTLYADYYSRGLDVNQGFVEGYDETYGTNIVVPAVWYGDDGLQEAETVTTIADLGDIGCESIVLREGITTIENNAFANDKSLARIVIPTSVTSIGTGIFMGCENLVKKQFAGNDTLEVKDGIVLSADKKTALLYVGDAPEGTVTVPASVTRIERYTFSYANIKKLVVPATVNEIVEYAFANSLIREADVSMGTQKYLPQNAFDGSPLLTTVTLAPSITTLQVSAFANCKSLSSITIGAEKINLRNRAFYYCSSLESFPFEKVAELGESVFAFAGIKSFSFNDGVTEVKEKQFENWNNLEKVTLPASIETIGTSAFDGCGALTTVELAGDSRLKTIGQRAFAGTKLSALDLTECTQFTTIGANAFFNCTSLTSVKLPDSLEVIGTAAFAGCSALEEMTLPFVGSYNYEGFQVYFEESFMPSFCNSLAYSLMAHNGAYYLAQYKADPDNFIAEYMNKAGQVWYELHKPEQEDAYYEKTLVEIFGTTQLFGYIFGSNSYAGSTLIQQYTAVGDSGTPTTYNFYIPQSLNKITVTGKAVSACAFNSMLSYTGTFEFTENLTDIGANAFRTLTAIPAFDFSTAPNLKTIGANAFSSDRGLTQVVLPDSLENVGASAFRFCSNLATVQVPAASSAKPLVLSAYAFGDCTSLSSFYGKGDTPTEGTFKFKNVDLSNYTFLNCSQLKIVESRESVGFILGYYGAEGSSLICNPFYTDSLIEVNFPTNASGYRYTLPTLSSGVKPTTEEAEQQGFMQNSIPGRLFYGCGGLERFNSANGVDVVIPEGITAIGPFAFQAYTGPSVPNMPIETVSFPTSLKKIYDGAFGHTDLKDVDASMVEDLSSGFDFANKLERIIISKTLKLTPQVLRSCANLKTVALKAADGTVTEEKGVVLLPDGTTEIPNYAFQNSGIEVVKLSETIRSIGTYAFYGAESLHTVELPDSLEIIGNGAFERCFGLTEVKFAESGKLNFIGNAAFEYCTSLVDISIPEGVIYLGADAFMGSINLEKVTLPATLFYAGGSSLFCNCLSLKEVVLFGSVPPQIDFDIAATSYAYSAFNIADQNYIASIPAAVAAELAKIPQTVTQNDRTMTENLKDFDYLIEKNGLKIYIPEDAKTLYDENIANGLRVVGGTVGGKGQRKDFGWHNYKKAFTTFESGVYAKKGETSPISFYLAGDGSAWFKKGTGAYEKAAVSGNTYTVGSDVYTYDAAANALSLGGETLKSIGGIYMDVTANFSTGSTGTTDEKTRLLQFRPQLTVGAGGAAAMYVYDGSRQDYDTDTVYVPNLYYGSYALAWDGDNLTVTLTFSNLTLVRFRDNYAYIETGEIRDSAESDAKTVTVTLTEQNGAFVSGTVTGTKLGDKEIVFTRGCTVTG